MDTTKRPLGYSVNAVKERAQKNRFACQQSLLIGLLNHYAKITIKRAKKASMRTSTIPVVTQIEIEASKVDVISLANERSERIREIELQKGVPSQTVERRFNKNVSAFVQNFVFDTCLEMGFFFNSKLSKKSKKSLQIERIDTVFDGDHMIADKDNILKTGEILNKLFTEKLNDKRVVVLEKGNPEIEAIVFANVF
ncbi:hypothetical protein EIN_277140 [Entamoeba invadens IP1]|uniref:Uncharacterized protein n=1 Tax=Entamoeba invadens IP1 TaxID=370355 RepID=A0A0A1TVC9_ENTIV|nr:hypothetical protein EIN_277140 [Entamoeba invadens IP1]ELP84334.1 hypothetical protein EIN_277140 [Entamoeba invadens IP1]|eukprot:XP_004183680.1 hypothetical protein EIN_277140 [Entamoeba invadens IP1]